MNEPAWFRQRRDKSERFARALERGATHQDDAEFGAELAVVSALRQLATEPVVGDDARARMRARILAADASSETEAESGSTPAGEPSDEPAAVPLRPAARRRHHGTWLVAAAAAGFLCIGLVGVELSEDALPGDFLYDVKRTTEALALDLTFSDDARAIRQLAIASERIGELEALVARHDERGDGSHADPVLYYSVLNDLDTAASLGSQSVTSLAARGEGATLAELSGWAAGSVERMSGIKAGMPAAVVGRFESSVDLLEQIERRAVALGGRLNCTEIGSGRVDDLGAVPSEAACDARPASYDLYRMYERELGKARPTATSGQQLTAAPSVPPAPTVEPGPTPTDGGALPPADVGDVDAPDQVDEGIDTDDPGATDKLSLTPPPVPTTSAVFPRLPTADLP